MMNILCSVDATSAHTTPAVSLVGTSPVCSVSTHVSINRMRTMARQRTVSLITSQSEGTA